MYTTHHFTEDELRRLLLNDNGNGNPTTPTSPACPTSTCMPSVSEPSSSPLPQSKRCQYQFMAPVIVAEQEASSRRPDQLAVFYYVACDRA
jgi:hypothetical protein